MPGATGRQLDPESINAVKLDQGDGTTRAQGGIGDAGKVQVAGEGPAQQARNRALSNVTTRQKVEWNTGSNITYLTVLAMLEEGTTLVAGAEKDVYAVLSIDAENDAEADGNLGTTSNPPSSATADAQFIPIPLGEFVKIPLTNALVNGTLGGGRVDVRSVDGTALNIWIGAN